MTQARTEKNANVVALGRRKNTTAWIANRHRKTQRRPITSENAAQAKRPAPLKIAISDTRLAAAVALAPAISSAIGAASEITAMPAVTLRNSRAHSAYHCHVLRASRNSKSRPERSVRSLVSGSHPSGL